MTTFIADKNINLVESMAFHAAFEITLIDLTYSNIKSLPEQFVWEARKLKSFICPFTLEIIETNAFYIVNCLKEIIIYSHLTQLSNKFLYNCPAITKIYYYGLNDFSDVNMIAGSTNQNNIHVYVTKLYRYQKFGQISVETFPTIKTCNNQNLYSLSNNFKLLTIFLSMNK